MRAYTKAQLITLEQLACELERDRDGSLLALSTQQPWAFCISRGYKPVENREWPCGFRGLLLIHAGKKYQTGMEHAIHADSPEVDVVEMRRAPRGAVVCVVRMSDCIGKRQDHLLPEAHRIWSDPHQFKFCFEGAVEFHAPIPFKGDRGLFPVPKTILHQPLRALLT